MRTLTLTDPALIAPKVPTYADVVLMDRPVGFWPCQDTSGGLVDISGNGFNATAVGSGHSYQQTGPGGKKAVSLTGTSLSGWDVADSNLWSPSVYTSFSFEAWVKSASPSDANQRMWMAKQRSREFHEWSGSSVANTNSVYGLALTGSDMPYSLVSSSSASGSAWNHVVVTFDFVAGRYGTKLYLNGVNISQTPTGSSSYAGQGPGTLGLGYRPGLSGAAYAWSGSMAYLAVYNSILSAAQIAAHYAAM